MRLIAVIIDHSGDPESRAAILDYLATAFPPRHHRATTQAAGDMTLRFEEWVVPTRGQRPRDPVAGPDGSIWRVNSGLGRLGSYDPRTGEIREWPSPSGPKSHPYAIAVFDGAIWYNESGVRPDMLVRFDPDTEAFRSWPIPSGDLYSGILRHMRLSRDGKALPIHQTATDRIARVFVEDRGTGGLPETHIRIATMHWRSASNASV